MLMFSSSVPPTAKPLFIFEMANNHMGDVDHGIAILRALRDACEGFDFRFAVKLQYRHIPDFIHPDFIDRKDLKFVKRFSETALSWDGYRRLKEAIVEHGFLSMCTPWDEPSVAKIVEHGFDFIKVPSCYLTDWLLAEKIAGTPLPLVISTAGEPFDQIDRVVSFYRFRGKTPAILHCVGEYPTPDHNLQLNQIDQLAARYPGLEIGYSTHEDPDETAAVMMAIAKGSTLFEKHVGLPTERYALNAYSANPQQVRRWLEAARRAYAMAGNSRGRHAFSPAEKATLGDLRRAIFAKRPIKAGESFTAADCFAAIPGAAGQLVANDLTPGCQLVAGRDFAPNEAIGFADVTLSMASAAVEAILHAVNDLVRTSGVVIPTSLSLDLSHHYGLDRFFETGSSTVTVVNRDYCKRIIILLPGQVHPEQWHETKDETLHVLFGEVSFTMGGKRYELKPNDVLNVPPGTRHEFRTQTGAVIEEISSSYSQSDSHYSDRSITASPVRKTSVRDWQR